MAGWTCPDNDLIDWNGTLRAKTFRGDGSQLTGIGAGAEVDPTFQAASLAINTHIASGSIHHPQIHALNSHTQGSDKIFHTKGSAFNEVSIGGVGTYLKSAGNGADLTWDTPTGGTGDSLWASGANFIYPIASNQTISGAGFISAGTISGGFILSSGNISGAYIYGDGSKLRNLPAGGELDPTFQAASLAYNTHLASGSIHFPDSSAAWNLHVASGMIHFSSAALWASMAYVTLNDKNISGVN
jgi:hypothetical protein